MSQRNVSNNPTVNLFGNPFGNSFSNGSNPTIENMARLPQARNNQVNPNSARNTNSSLQNIQGDLFRNSNPSNAQRNREAYLANQNHLAAAVQRHLELEKLLKQVLKINHQGPKDLQFYKAKVREIQQRQAARNSNNRIPEDQRPSGYIPFSRQNARYWQNIMEQSQQIAKIMDHIQTGLPKKALSIKLIAQKTEKRILQSFHQHLQSLPKSLMDELDEIHKETKHTKTEMQGARFSVKAILQTKIPPNVGLLAGQDNVQQLTMRVLSPFDEQLQLYDEIQQKIVHLKLELKEIIVDEDRFHEEVQEQRREVENSEVVIIREVYEEQERREQ